jgi:CheY-like chemotaxis protein
VRVASRTTWIDAIWNDCCTGSLRIISNVDAIGKRAVSACFLRPGLRDATRKVALRESEQMMSTQTQRLRIFVVDDEHVIALTLAAILRNEGFDAESFNEPLAALQAARLSWPNLLLTDVVMPRMSGIELAIQVRRDCPDCKVLLFSGQASTLDLLSEARRDGHRFDLLSKPAHPDILLKAVKGLLMQTTPDIPSG